MSLLTIPVSKKRAFFRAEKSHACVPMKMEHYEGYLNVLKPVESVKKT